VSRDDEAGSSRPPAGTRRMRGRSGHSGSRKLGRAATAAAATAEIIDKLLLATVDITENGSLRRATTLEAILLQLSKRALDGDRSAVAAWLEYQKLARQHTKPTIEITFVDSEPAQFPPTKAPTK
jgi:hypothetical protein